MLLFNILKIGLNNIIDGGYIKLVSPGRGGVEVNKHV